MELTALERCMIIEALEMVASYQEDELKQETEELIEKLEKGW